MSTRFLCSLGLVICLLTVMFPVAFATEAPNPEALGSAAMASRGDCASTPATLEPAPADKPVLPILEPEKIWSSANPCFVSCPNGGFIDCSWSWSGDPTYCCWKTATRCMSYNCNTGAIALSKTCPGY